MTPPPSERPPTIFISHRHEDRVMADAFRKAFLDWSDGTVGVFQSSNPGTGTTVGDDLDGALLKPLADAGVLLFLYTTVRADWTWCIYECGMAQDPATLATRIIVFHLPEQPPAPLSHLITLPFSQEALDGLADRFHKDPGFFPGQGEAIAPEVPEELIRERSATLHAALAEARALLEQIETHHRYDQITLSLPGEQVAQIRRAFDSGSFGDALDAAHPMIEEECLVVGVFGEPGALFDMEEIPRKTPFRELAQRWRKEAEAADDAWGRELFAEMTRAILNLKEGSLSTPIASLDPDSSARYLPILHTIRRMPRGAMEFDVIFCRIRGELT